MSVPKILCAAPVDFVPGLNTYMAKFGIITHANGRNREEIINILKTNAFDAWLVSPCPEYLVDEALLEMCPTIKIIATPSTGTNHLDVNAIKKRNIELYSLLGTEAVQGISASSEYAFTLLLSVVRKVVDAVEVVANGGWRDKEDLLRSRELKELTLGLVGFGRMGRNVARYAYAFGMKVKAYDPYVSEQTRQATEGVEFLDSLGDLAASVDCLMVCVVLNDETSGLIDKSVFQAVQSAGIYFINCSRGEVVVESDLIEAINAGLVLRAGVDVVVDEISGRQRNMLIKFARNDRRLIVTPHIAGLTVDSERKAQLAAFDAIIAHLCNV